MTTIYQRLWSELPTGWFYDQPGSVIGALLTGIAAPYSQNKSLLDDATLQARIVTATGIFLDMIAWDFFGASVMRKKGQSDNSFRTTIQANLFRKKGTRAAILSYLYDLTGRTAYAFEPQRPGDTGGYRVGGAGYGVAGAWGSVLLPYTGFIKAYLPLPTYSSGGGGYTVGGYLGYGTTGSYCHLSQSVTAQDVLDVVDSIKVAGTEVWVQINN